MNDKNGGIVPQSTSKYNLYLAVFIAYLGPAAVGFVAGWSSPSLVILEAPDSEFPVTHDQGAWLASLVPLGASIGPLISGSLLDSIGRRQTFLLQHLMLLIGWGLMCFRTIPVMYFARLLMGIAYGFSLAMTSIYIGEITDDSLRSTLNTMYPFFNKLPLLVTFGIGPHISYYSLLLVCSLPSLVFLILYKSLPESPFYLFMTNRDSDMIETLSRLRQLPESSVVEEARVIKDLFANKVEGSWRNLFTTRVNLRALMIVACLQFFWQYSWGTVVMVYAQPMVQHIGISLPSDRCAWVLAAMTWVGTALSPVLVSTWGYKRALLLSSVVCTLTMGVAAYFLGLHERGDNTPYVQWCIIISLVGFVISNYSAYYPISLSLLGEFFEPSMKAKGSTFLICIACLEASIAVYLYPWSIQMFSMSITYWFSFVVLCVATIFVAIFVPETSGLSFAQIQEVLNR
uniref:Major facilitator superfamily (MFS) profile domain-containing protein n=1 Tax=Graphocephala atropunctata TaxID=36148 RepID=A0A1B6M0R4_9HEMI